MLLNKTRITKYKMVLYNKITSNIKLFDVSMRDGLQSLSKIYSMKQKKSMLDNIIHKYRPHRMEVGSIVSPKLLPQMNHSVDLYKYAVSNYGKNNVKDKNNKFMEREYNVIKKNIIENEYNEKLNWCISDYNYSFPVNNKNKNKNNNSTSFDNNKYKSIINQNKADYICENDDNPINCDFYLLVPPVKTMVENAINNNIKNISTITSVSNSFQQKNIKMSCNDTKKALNDLIVNNSYQFENIKLYISCITHCPINGKQDKDYIINEILYYSQLNRINELCLSDTCGTMEFIDFKYILDTLCSSMKINDFNKISLHLHVDEKNIKNVNKIIDYSLKNGMYNFDVTSFTDIGGCVVTMDKNKNKINGNLTYNQIIESINLYK